MPEDEFKLKAIFEIDEKSIREIQKKLAEGLEISTGGSKTKGGGGGTPPTETGGDIGDVVGKMKDVVGDSGFGGLKDIGTKMQSLLGEKGMGAVSDIASKVAPGMGKAMAGITKMGEAGAQIAGKGASALAGMMGGSAGGGAVGATLGSIAPGVGTAIGLAVGVAMGPILEDVLGPIMEFAKQASPMIETVMMIMQTTMMLFVRPFADFLMLILMPVMIIIMKYIAIPFYQYVYPRLMDLIKLIEPFLPDLANVVIVILGVLLVFTVLVLAPLISIVVLIIGLVALAVVLWRAYEKFMNWLFEFLGKAWDFISGTLWEKGIKPVLDWLIRIGTTVLEFITGIWSSIYKEVVEPIILDIWDILSTFWNLIETIFGPVVEGVKFIWDAVEGPLTEAWAFIKEKLGSVVDFILQIPGWIWDQIVLGVQWIKTNIIDEVTGPIISAVDFVKGAVDTVAGWITTVYNYIVDTIITKITSVTDLVQDVYDAISGFVSGGLGVNILGMKTSFVPLGPEQQPMGFGGSPSAKTVNVTLNQKVDGYVNPDQLVENAGRQFAFVTSRVMRG